ncbi:hypothetical protein [Peribacillus butanolivorans]
MLFEDGTGFNHDYQFDFTKPQAEQTLNKAIEFLNKHSESF